MDKETFRPRRPTPASESPSPVNPMSMDTGVNIQGPIPKAFQEALARAKTPQEPVEVPMDEVPGNTQKMIEQMQRAQATRPRHQEPEDLPVSRMAFSGIGTQNTKLDELIAGIKETVYKYEEIVLPSKGKFYEDNTAPPDGKLHIRCMTGEEEGILSTTRYIRKGQAIDMVFRNCVRESIVPEKLLSADRTYLLIFLRGISHGTDYEVQVRCPSCSHRFSTTIDLDGLLVNNCPDDFGPDALSGVLPTTHYNFTYRLPTGRDEQSISDYREKRTKQFGDQANDDTWNYRAATLIDEIEGLTEKTSIKLLINRLPISDVAYIRSCMNEPPFGVDSKVELFCSMCNEEFSVEMPMEANFFFPKPRKERPTPVSS